ncbi:nucleotidyltransferase domain-containing protein [Thermoclostridium caenicola]|uniref:Uncharacterized nucleotidyltransferase n=1 Tax=Thermoclostridium caenicola TaxID=659425 RepID=A0A1M6J3Y5_9FIRM|nr:nucleotidyltransferase family protein [Thermoclostridium caenicola]SHJ41291.1 Uncharacterised nucleotidyltransferase [Thermoclostridium caenicola]
MTKAQKVVAELLSATINNKKAVNITEESDWHEIFRLAEEHQIQSLLYSVVKDLPGENGVPGPDLLRTWKEVSFISAVGEANKFRDACRILSAFHEAGLPFIVLKGIVLRDLYPKPELRTMCDLDVFIAEEHVGKAREILGRLGYKESESTYKHICFTHEKHLMVELHTRLLDMEFAEKTKEWESGMWNNAIAVSICDIPVRTFSNEDHLIFLCLHLLNHFLVSGYGVRQLYDIAVFISGMYDRIQWNAFLSKVKELRISNFVSLVFNVCAKLFNIDIPQEIPGNCPDEKTLDMVIDDVFTGGVFGNEEAGHIISGVLNSYIGDRKKMPNRATRIFYLLFPPYRVMKRKYKYIEKFPVLLPFAWMQRFFMNLFGKNRLFKKSKDYLALLNTHKVYEERFSIIKKLKLFEE